MNTIQGIRTFSPKYDKETDETVITIEFWHETNSSKKNEKFTIPEHTFNAFLQEFEETYGKINEIYRHVKEISINIDATR